MVEGSERDLRDAEVVLNNYGIRDWGIYDTPAGSTNTPAARY